MMMHKVPMEIAGELRALGRVIAPLETAKLYAPVHANAPTDSVKATSNIAYGSHARHRLDVYEPVPRPQRPMPVLIFIHGGGFVGGGTKSSRILPITPTLAITLHGRGF
jgi:acetyl esterase/lipase